MSDDHDYVEDLCALVKEAGCVMTFDRARNNTHACERCGKTNKPRKLVDIGHYPNGSVITRPVCVPCLRPGDATKLQPRRETE